MAGYYRTIRGVRYDRSLLERAEQMVRGRGDGRISEADAEKLLRAVQDGPGMTKVETRTLLFISQSFKLTPPARERLAGAVTTPEPIDYQAVVRKIAQAEFDVPRLSFRIDTEEITRQNELSPGLPFTDAYREALRAYFRAKPRGNSPWGMVMNIHELFPGEVSNAEERIKSHLQAHLAYGNMVLLPPYSPETEFEEEDLQVPPMGETVARNWIFGLTLEQLGDQYFWIVVPRSGAESSIYGFN